jgi:hypothetical protein
LYSGNNYYYSNNLNSGYSDSDKKQIYLQSRISIPAHLVKHLYIGVLSFAGKSFNQENRGSDKVCPA